MIRKHHLISLLLLGLGLGLGAGVSAASLCSGAVEPPDCIHVDDSGDLYPDYSVTNECPHAVTLQFDVKEDGEDWILDRNNFTALYGYMAVQPDETDQSGIRYDTELTIHCCPGFGGGTSCSGEPLQQTPE